MGFCGHNWTQLWCGSLEPKENLKIVSLSSLTLQNKETEVKLDFAQV